MRLSTTGKDESQLEMELPLLAMIHVVNANNSNTLHIRFDHHNVYINNTEASTNNLKIYAATIVKLIRAQRKDVFYRMTPPL